MNYVIFSLLTRRRWSYRTHYFQQLTFLGLL